LPGVLGSEAWPTLSESEKERVLVEIGQVIAEVQRVPLGDLANIEPRWDRFLSAQIAGCRARHERLGLPRKFLDGLDELLRDAERLIPLDRPPVILTGEYIPENFLLGRDSAGWRVSGLIDFGDVMSGWCEYDLLGPSGFMTAGMPRRVRSLFEGYGYSSADINPDLKRRLMALTLLHRFSDPARQICIEGWQERADNLFELQDLLWPI
jgi:hygromycin-B 7''-O-kinase